MNISVTHSTVDRYDYLVQLELRFFRLRPRTNSSQRLVIFHIQIAPTPTGAATECLDQDGRCPERVVQHAYPRVECTEPIRRGNGKGVRVRLRAHRRIANSAAVVSGAVVRGAGCISEGRDPDLASRGGLVFRRIAITDGGFGFNED